MSKGRVDQVKVTSLRTNSGFLGMKRVRFFLASLYGVWITLREKKNLPIHCDLQTYQNRV